jgi:general secretion pathway protein D
MALTTRTLLLLGLLATGPAASMDAQADTLVSVREDSITARLINVDLRLAIQALARHLDRPVVMGPVGELRVTLETPRPIPRSRVLELLRGLIRPYNLTLTEEAAVYLIGPPPPIPSQAPASAGAVQLFVLPVRHARAVDVAATVNALFGRAGTLGELGAPPRTLAQGLRQNLVPPAGAPEPGPDRPIVAQVAELSGNVTIVPDLRTNSLLIRSSQEDFNLIRAAVERLDVRPLQVLVEVVIAELRRDRSLSFGLGVLVPRQRISGTNTEISGASTGLSTGDLVLTIMKSGSFDVTATLRAAASRGDATILSRPVLLAANNETAEILVGSQRPFVQVQRALPTDAPVRDQVIQFKDVGTKLTVRPTISADGYVTLHVTQEVNAATAEIAFDAPVISTRTIQTQLLVKDGHTAVLGGLADKQQDVTRAGVPLLSGIPILGGLFGRHVKRDSETELFIFLTPRVLHTDEDLDEASDSIGERTRRLRAPN